ncbi:NAD(P) transhydrogenase subunit alpha [Natroniella sp. ANB-PHB2]|uniref:NAD(P) transhydrogenase subunit alpha n=1 Tax=Natroniella sp. ANB-PHB2 TaxID=3384444 RepID=UPI0038D3A0AF
MLLVMVVFLIIASFLGYRVISSVPSLLHTPLMSGMNALSGITVLGAIEVYATASSGAKIWALVALVLAMINVVGGFWVTGRMLRMFKEGKEKSAVGRENL